jgi:hypothetical protein
MWSLDYMHFICGFVDFAGAESAKRAGVLTRNNNTW